MNNALSIAVNTFKQALRDRILYGIFIFAVLFIGSTIVLSSLSLGENLFVIRNFGLSGIYIFGLIITIFLGASTVYEEVEKKTTYLLLSKPISRADIVVGKFAGLLAAIALTTTLMLITYLLVISMSGGGFDASAFWVVALQILEMGVLIGVLILFSIITTPLAAITYTILLLYVGHLLSLMKNYSKEASGFAKYILLSVYYIFPNLEKFNIRNLVVHEISVPPKEILISTSYAAVYVILLLYLAVKLFNRKEL